MNSSVFTSLPVLAVYIGVALSMLVSSEAGYQIGKRVRSHQDQEALGTLGPMVGGLLGLLAFVLAFTFSMAASNHESRKQNVLLEANAVGTAYLRADLLESPYGNEVKDLLREYVDIRLRASSGRDLDAALLRSVEIHGLLWDRVSSAALSAPDTNTALMVQSLNDVIDMHEKRVTAALRNRIPGSIWSALMAISILAMVTLGTQAGLSGRRRLVAVIPLALAFAVLVTLVADLDRPQKGMIKIGQQAMESLQATMNPDSQ